MELAIKRTHELSLPEKQQICVLYNEVFGKTKLLDKFDRQFSGTFLGYSYHAVLIDKNNIVGSWSFIPYRYIYFGKSLTFVLSVDTMILQRYRGRSGTLVTMADLSYQALRKEDIPFVLGFPNDKFYPITRKVLGWEEIGMLDYYILPIRIGSIYPFLSIFNLISISFAWMCNIGVGDMDKFSTADDPADPHIRKVSDDVFFAYRYDKNYRVTTYPNNGYFVYRIYLEKTIRSAYILDFYPRRKEHLERIVSHIYRAEKNNIDVILYIGNLNYQPRNLLRVPMRFQPKKVNMCGKILLDDAVDGRIFNLANWHVNLSNYDVR